MRVAILLIMVKTTLSIRITLALLLAALMVGCGQKAPTASPPKTTETKEALADLQRRVQKIEEDFRRLERGEITAKKTLTESTATRDNVKAAPSREETKSPPASSSSPFVEGKSVEIVKQGKKIPVAQAGSYFNFWMTADEKLGFNRPVTTSQCRMRLRTQLGGEAFVTRPWLWHNARSDCVLLRRSPGLYVSIPIYALKSVVLRNEKHEVTLGDKRKISGELCSTIEDGSRKYDLATVSEIEVLENYAWTKNDSPQGASEIQPWHLKLPSGDTLQIAEPRLSFQYYTTSGYIMGGANRVSCTPHFKLKVDSKIHECNFEDFIAVLLTRNDCMVRSAQATETKGLLTLSHTDDKGAHAGERPEIFAWDVETGMNIQIRLHELWK